MNRWMKGSLEERNEAERKLGLCTFGSNIFDLGGSRHVRHGWREELVGEMDGWREGGFHILVTECRKHEKMDGR